jgi:hydrogenase maturation protease
MEMLDTLSSVLQEKTCIVGMGNYFRKDDAIGIHIVEQLQQELPGEGDAIISVEDVLENYAFKIAESECSNVLLIDAVSFESEPGSIVFGELHEFDDMSRGGTSHKPCLEMVDKIFSGHNKRTYLLGIVVSDTGFGTGFSPEVISSADIIKDFLKQNFIRGQKGAYQ